MKVILPTLLIVGISGKPTILISSDGFRWDYYGRVPTPGIDKIIASGLRVKNLKNSFATVTFPNHYTLVTGKFEESHGIVDNSMLDPTMPGESFDMTTTDPKWWNGGEPVWVTARKANISSVCVNWVGCTIEGQQPTFWNPYNWSLSYQERIDIVTDKILRGDAQLGLLYFEEPDHACHEFGPDSDQVSDAIRRVDNAIVNLLSKINLDLVNVIFTSDHGGIAVATNKIIVLENHTDGDFPYELAASGAVAHVWPLRTTDTESLLAQLVSSIPKNAATCFKKNSIPNRLHYTHNPRIAPIVCIAELGWTLVHRNEDRNRFTMLGSHGYDASLDENSPMRPVFVAGGPDIQRYSHTILEPFENVNVFPLVAKLLDIPESAWPKINGTLNAVKHLLTSHIATNFETVVIQW